MPRDPTPAPPVMWALRAADHLADRLFAWLVAGAAVGVAVSGPAARLATATPVVLGVMVAGLGLGVPLGRLSAGLGRPRVLAAVLLAQLVVTPLLGAALARLGDPVGVGAAIQSVAPAEITSPLLVGLAGGAVAVALPVMALTVLLAPVTMPPLLRLLVGASLDVSSAELFWTLVVTVAVPLLAGSAASSAVGRSRGGPDQAVLRRLGRGLSAAMVVLLVVAVAGRATRRVGQVGPGILLPAAGAAAVLVVAGFGLGWLAARAAAVAGPDAPVVVFSVGMREFGVATAVALSFAGPGAALVPALYGPLMMIVSARLADRLARPRAIGDG